MSGSAATDSIERPLRTRPPAHCLHDVASTNAAILADSERLIPAQKRIGVLS